MHFFHPTQEILPGAIDAAGYGPLFAAPAFDLDAWFDALPVVKTVEVIEYVDSDGAFIARIEAGAAEMAAAVALPPYRVGDTVAALPSELAAAPVVEESFETKWKRAAGEVVKGYKGKGKSNKGSK